LAPADSAAAAAVDHWLQWEAGQLRAAVFAGGDAAAAALAQLDGQLSKGKPFLAGSSITLADVSVLCLLEAGTDVCMHPQLLTTCFRRQQAVLMPLGSSKRLQECLLQLQQLSREKWHAAAGAARA
jgi:glutathione S-transferase